MKHWKVVFAIGCGLIVAGCGEESAVQKAVRARLKDPDSAKFGEGTFVKGRKGDSYACFTVNSKNSMGGYSGDKQAFLIKLKDEWEVIGMQEFSHEQCINLASMN